MGLIRFLLLLLFLYLLFRWVRYLLGAGAKAVKNRAPEKPTEGFEKKRPKVDASEIIDAEIVKEISSEEIKKHEPKKPAS